MANTWAEFAEAFSIFAKYGDEPYSTEPAHDAIYSGPHPDKVSAEDRARLDELGWFVDEDVDDCFCKFT